MSPMLNYEQAVYGSFPFRAEGYAPLAHSPGCETDWLDTFHLSCRAIGDKPPQVGPVSGMMFAQRVGKRGPWMIVGVSSPGVDDRGRPDALAFHALFVTESEFRKVAFDPFALVPALRSDWTSSTTLQTGSIPVESPHVSDTDDRAAIVAVALSRGQKVAIGSESPLVELASTTWSLLTEKDRKRCSVATWAFANGPRFDFVATPNLAAWDFDPAYVDPAAVVAQPKKRAHIRKGVVALGLAAVALGFGVWRATNARNATGAIPDVPPANNLVLDTRFFPKLRPKDMTPGPALADYQGRSSSPEDEAAVKDRLRVMLSTFDARQISNRDPFTGAEVSSDDGDDITAMLRAISQFRFGGELLTSTELSQIARSNDAGRSRALAWDRHIRHFVADRPLPENLAEGPLRWKIDTLAWSFHIEPDPRLTVTEALDALADAMKLDEPIKPNPLQAKYPALTDYAAFLKRIHLR